ncbi:putative ADP-ribosylation factor [Serendipita vermifera]|nr:putative ADP-ribosylation factor [Serendipita vermifera]
MGGYISRLSHTLSALIRPTEVRIVVIGFSGAAESRCDRDLAGCWHVQPCLLSSWLTMYCLIFTGFSIRTAQYKNVIFSMWGMRAETWYRQLGRHYSQNSHGIIYVVDCADIYQMVEAREELQRFISSDNLICAPLLVLANKQDLPNSWSPLKVTDFLGLDNVMDREWYVQATCATQGDGLHEGLEWLTHAIRRR